MGGGSGVWEWGVGVRGGVHGASMGWGYGVGVGARGLTKGGVDKKTCTGLDLGLQGGNEVTDGGVNAKKKASD